MNLRIQISERAAKLSFLESSEQKGESGAPLARFAGSLDDVSAREMTQAIEVECERVGSSQW